MKKMISRRNFLAAAGVSAAALGLGRLRRFQLQLGSCQQRCSLLCCFLCTRSQRQGLLSELQARTG